MPSEIVFRIVTAFTSNLLTIQSCLVLCKMESCMPEVSFLPDSTQRSAEPVHAKIFEQASDKDKRDTCNLVDLAMEAGHSALYAGAQAFMTIAS